MTATEGAVAALEGSRAGKVSAGPAGEPTGLDLPRNGGLAYVESLVVAGVPGPGPGLLLGSGAEPPRVAGAPDGGLSVLDEEADDRTGVRYAVSKTVSFDLSYEMITDESMAFEVAESGSLRGSYNSHNLVFQARWEF